MEPKDILIRILSRFSREGTDAAVKGINQIKQATRDAASSVAKSAGDFKKFGDGIRNALTGFRNLSGGILGALNPLNLFNNIFGRVTLGLLTWEAWRRVKAGFDAIADATVNANAKMQVARGAFTAFAGGSTRDAETFIGILKQLSIQTGASFDVLLDNAKALPTKVGRNFQAFAELSKTAIALGFLDPAQGVEGAFFALRNALEGGGQGLRSLIQRFEIGTVAEFNAALEETGDILSALQLMLARTGLDVDSFIESQRNTYPVVIEAIRSITRELLRISTESVFNLITQDLVALRDWFQKNQLALEALATAFGQKLTGAYQMLQVFIRDILFAGQEITVGSVFVKLVEVLEWVANALERIARFIINTITVIAEAINTALGWIGLSTDRAATQVKQSTSGLAQEIDRALEQVGTTMPAAVEKAAEKIAAAPLAIAKSAEEVIGSLTGLVEGGKETIGRFVENLVEGMDADALTKVRDAILDNVIDLEQQQLRQEKSIKKIEDWVDAAAKEVEKARDRLKLFDINTADIPERFTRARRRQLELEVMRAEQEKKRRKEALDAAKEELAVTKDILAAQRQVLSVVEQALKDAEKGAGGGIFTGFTEPPFDVEAWKAKVGELSNIFSEKLGPIAERFKEDFGKLGDFIRALFGEEGGFSKWAEQGERLREAISGIRDKLAGILDFFDNLFASYSGWWAGLEEGPRKFLLVLLGVLALKAGAIPVAFKLVWSMGGILANLGGATAAALIGIITGTGGATLAALALPIAILVAEVWLGREELSKWFSGERPLQLAVILSVKGQEVINKILELFGMEQQEVTADASKLNIWGGALDAVRQALGQTEQEISGAEDDMAQAAEGGILRPIMKVAEDIYEALVGGSIFPDMMDMIVDLFGRLSSRLDTPLQTIRSTIIGQMQQMSAEWIMEWQKMVEATVLAMEQINMAQMEMQTASARQSTQAAVPEARTRSEGLLDRIRIELNANETRRLMQDGVADGMFEVAQYLRKPGR